tara:strand:- start:215 stop:379 length:165 start_codon:yes stop_codon:yes gene_type:complete
MENHMSDKISESTEDDLELKNLEKDLALIEAAMEKIDQEDLAAYEAIEAEISEK